MQFFFLFLLIICSLSRLPWWLVVKNLPANVGDVGLIPGLGRSPGEKKWQLTLEFLPGKPHGERTLAHYSPGVISFWCIAK